MICMICVYVCTHIQIMTLHNTQILMLRTSAESRRSELTALQDRLRDRDIQIESLENDLASLSNQLSYINTASQQLRSGAGAPRWPNENPDVQQATRNSQRWTQESSDFVTVTQPEVTGQMESAGTFDHSRQRNLEPSLDVGQWMMQGEGGEVLVEIERLRRDLDDALKAQEDAEKRAGEALVSACWCVCDCVCMMRWVCVFVRWTCRW